MPDIADLLFSAARSPLSPLEIAQVEHRARVLVRRQRAVQLGCAAVALALVVPVAMRFSGAEPVGLKQVPAQSTSPSPSRGGPLPPAVAQGPALGAARASLAPVPTLVPGLSAPASPRPSTRATPAATTKPSPATTGSEYPPQSSCEIRSFGLLPGESRTCRFTATASGGWRYHYSGGGGMAYPSYEVTVVRRGVTYRSPGDTGAVCSNSGIQPGDRVTLRITQESRGYDELRLAAGAGYRCGTR